MKVGRVVRVWKPNDQVMHCKTFLVIGESSRAYHACKIEQKAKISQHDIENCALIRVHQEPPVWPNDINYKAESFQLKPLIAQIFEGQELVGDCMVDLERSYDIGREDQYELVDVGSLSREAKRYARKIHIDLYSSKYE